MASEINKRIREVRKANGYSQEEFARYLGMKTSTYSQMERRGNISCDILLKICEIFDFNADYFLYGITKKPKKNKSGQIVLFRDAKMAEEIHVNEINLLISEDFREQILLIAMRNLDDEAVQEIYEFIMDKLKEI